MKMKRLLMLLIRPNPIVLLFLIHFTFYILQAIFHMLFLYDDEKTIDALNKYKSHSVIIPDSFYI